MLVAIWAKITKRKQGVLSKLDLFLLTKELKWVNIKNCERYCEGHDWIYKIKEICEWAV